MKRVENLVREQVSGMIMKGVIKDPRINSLLSITEVHVSKDLAYADLYISGFEGEKKVQQAVDALNHAAGFVQYKLRGKIRLRTTPKLRFKKDNAIEHGFMLTQKLKDLAT